MDCLINLYDFLRSIKGVVITEFFYTEVSIPQHRRYNISISFTYYGSLFKVYFNKTIYYRAKVKSNERIRITVNNNNIYVRMSKMKDMLIDLINDEKYNHYKSLHHIYVDGSFKNNQTRWAYAIIKDDTEVLNGSGFLVGYEQHYQIGGELCGVMEAIKACLDRGLNEVVIFYDFLGIEYWITGKWRAKVELTQQYVEFIKNCGVNIHWVKVKSHSGDKWNDFVDNLADKLT